MAQRNQFQKIPGPPQQPPISYGKLPGDVSPPLPIYSASSNQLYVSQQKSKYTKSRLAWILFFVFSLIVLGAAIAGYIVLLAGEKCSITATLTWILVPLAGIAIVAAIWSGYRAFRKENRIEKEQ